MTTFDTMTRSALARIRGEVLFPGDDGFAAASQGWNLAVTQAPAAVVFPHGETDIQHAVRFAAESGIGAAVMSTGHGVATPADGGLLVRTSRLSGVHVDAGMRRALVQSGARWTDLMPLAGVHGRTGLPGSSLGVGVVGYSLGGGFGWLGRKFGLSSTTSEALAW